MINYHLFGIDFLVPPTFLHRIPESFESLCLYSVQKRHCMLRFHSIFSISRPFLSLSATFLIIAENVCSPVTFRPPFYRIFNVNFKFLTSIFCNVINQVVKLLQVVYLLGLPCYLVISALRAVISRFLLLNSFLHFSALTFIS